MEPVATLGLKAFNTRLPAGQLNVRCFILLLKCHKTTKKSSKFLLY